MRGIFLRELDIGACKQEVKELLKMAFPMAITNLSLFLPLFVSQNMSGFLGTEALDGVSLALTIIDLTGISVVQGVSSAVDTLFSQVAPRRTLLHYLAFQNVQHLTISLYLLLLQIYPSIIFTFLVFSSERSAAVNLKGSNLGIWIMFLTCLPIWGLFLNIGPILIAVGQDPTICRIAENSIAVYMFGLPAYGLIIILSKYLQVQSIIKPSLLIGIVVNLVNAYLHAVFLFVLQLETRYHAISPSKPRISRSRGPTLALALSHWMSVLLHVSYIVWRGLGETWKGWTKRGFFDWGKYIKLAIPGLFMTCLEFWGPGISVFIVGLLGKTEFAAFTAVYYFEILFAEISFGISLAGGLRLGRYLGSADSRQARISFTATMFCGFCYAACVAVLCAALKDVLPKFLSSDPEVRYMVAPLILQLVLYKSFDVLQLVCGGLLRGMGHQAFGAIFNSIGYLALALPISAVLVLKTKLGVAGAFWGMSVGSFTIFVTYFVRLVTADWDMETEQVLARVGANSKDNSSDKMKARDDIQLVRMVDTQEGNKNYESIDRCSEEPSNLCQKSSLKEGLSPCKIVILMAFVIILIGAICIRIYRDK